MQIIDLSHTIAPEMPVYPGTEPPVFRTGSSIAESGFMEHKITMYSHTGTHVDAPAHLIKGAKSLDQFPIEHFCGQAFAMHWPNAEKRSIDVDDVLPYEGRLAGIEYLLIDTRWSRFWGTDAYLSEYPVLTREAAAWLAGFGFKGVGIDTISADSMESYALPIHNIFLQNDTLIIENLNHLDKLPKDRFLFTCFPLKFDNADGSPVRAVAMIR